MVRATKSTVMGYNTIIMLRNDCSEALEDEDRLQEIIKNAICQREKQSHGIGSCANGILSMGTRHADEDSFLYYGGNTLSWISPYSPEFEQIMREQPSWADSIISIMESELEKIKKKRAKIRESFKHLRPSKAILVDQQTYEKLIDEIDPMVFWATWIGRSNEVGQIDSWPIQYGKVEIERVIGTEEDSPYYLGKTDEHFVLFKV